jgi:Domain of unknown function (DUF4190)
MNRRATPARPAARLNAFAIASLVCGFIQFAGVIGVLSRGIIQFAGVFPAGIVAIVLGHTAARQIRRTGEGGYGLAQAGLLLGYVGLALLILGTLVVLALRAYFHLWSSYNW